MKTKFEMGEIVRNKKNGFTGFIAGKFFFETLTLHYLIIGIKKLMPDILEKFEQKPDGHYEELTDPEDLEIFKHEYGNLFTLPPIYNIGDLVKKKKSKFKGIIISILLHEYGVNYGLIDYPEKEKSKFTYLDTDDIKIIEEHFWDNDKIRKIIIN